MVSRTPAIYDIGAAAMHIPQDSQRTSESMVHGDESTSLAPEVLKIWLVVQ